MIQVTEGQSPLILCLPHSGTEIPAAVYKRLNATGRLQADIAWRLERVFDFAQDLDATVIGSTVSRLVIDLDKDPETPASAAFDPAKALCPATTLDGKRIYQDREEPGPTEIEQRMLLFFLPFHQALRRQIGRLQRLHRDVVVVDCQSMRSHIKGVTDKGDGLPLVNIGSAGGQACDPDLRNLLTGSFKGVEGYSVSVDAFAKGGFITRSFGRPQAGVHALTLLLAQSAYLRHESPPFEPDKQKLQNLQAVLQDAVSRLIDWTGVSDLHVLSGEAPQPPASALDVTDREEDSDDNVRESDDPDSEGAELPQVAE